MRIPASVAQTLRASAASLKFAPQIRVSRTVQNINSDPFDRLRANGIFPDSSLPPFVLSLS